MLAVFPEFPGLTFEGSKVPGWSTSIQVAVSGKEARAANWVYPKWSWTLVYEVLRQDTLLAELAQLVGFFNQRRGAWESFYYRDPTDCQATSQRLGLGNGSLENFPLIREFGGFVEPVGGCKTMSAVYLNGVAQTTGWTASGTMLSFSLAPATGVVVSADFEFYHLVRFVRDEIEVRRFVRDLWEARKVELVSDKV